MDKEFIESKEKEYKVKYIETFLEINNAPSIHINKDMERTMISSEFRTWLSKKFEDFYDKKIGKIREKTVDLDNIDFIEYINKEFRNSSNVNLSILRKMNKEVNAFSKKGFSVDRLCEIFDVLDNGNYIELKKHLLFVEYMDIDILEE